MSNKLAESSAGGTGYTKMNLPPAVSKVLLITLLAIVLAACSREPRTLVLFPTLTPDFTQTPVIVEVTSQVFVPITTTPEPTSVGKYLCVTANENVYLRPSPGTEFYPLQPLPNGTRVRDTGTKDGDWVFVEYGDKAGWVNSAYLGGC